MMTPITYIFTMAYDYMFRVFGIYDGEDEVQSKVDLMDKTFDRLFLYVLAFYLPRDAYWS